MIKFCKNLIINNLRKFIIHNLSFIININYFIFCKEASTSILASFAILSFTAPGIAMP
jgi:hypothetical protein